MDLTSALTATGQALQLLKELNGVLSAAESKLKIVELTGLLANVKTDLTNATIVLKEKDDVIEGLTKKLEHRDIHTFRYKGYNFELDNTGRSTGRPFCPACEQAGHLIHIVRAPSGVMDLCPNCNAVYSDYPGQLPESIALAAQADFEKKSV